MRIGHIAYTYKPIIGGCETYISTLKDLLSEEGHSQRIYQVKRRGLKDEELRQVTVFNIFRRKPLYFYNLFLNFFFLDFLREDLLIVHDPFHYPPVAWQRCIVVSHGVRWDRPQKSEYWYCKLHYWSGKFALKYAKKFVANDTNFYRQLGISLKPKEGMFKEIKKNRWFIPNCVDSKMFKKVKSNPSLAALNPVLVPRNIVRGRGIHLAISAYKEFHKKFKDTNLVICGDFADVAYKFEIFRQISELDLVGKVYFIGSVDWQIMPHVYSSSLMSVIPTIYEEGTSLAALESMACGTPTVSTNVGGLADLPTLQSEPTVEDLVKKMIECFESRKRLLTQQQNEVHKIYNIENFKKAWLKVIEGN